MDVTFAVIAPALLAGHHVADYWFQTQHQVDAKGQPGWPGRIACLAHVTTYTAVLLAAVLAAASVSEIHLNWMLVAAGLAVSAATHYWADRRVPLRRLADRLHKSPAWLDHGGGIQALDQSWHIGWLFIAALIIG